MFRCPTDGKWLSAVKPYVGALWVCGNCGGRAAKISLIRKFTPAAVVDELWEDALRSDAVREVPCPVCARLMAKVPVPGRTRTIAVDVCASCQLVWCDSKEIEQVPPALSSPQSEAPQGASKDLANFKAQFPARTLALAEMPDEGQKSWAGVLLGLPVESAAAGSEAKSWVTWNLAGVIALVSLFGFLKLDVAVGSLGLKPAEAMRFGGATFITSFFIHGSFLHLLGNLSYLLVFGRRVEAILGARRYLIVIAAAALGGALAHVLTNPGSTVPLVGASGGISGVITLYALDFPDAQLSFFIYYRWFRVRAIKALAIWVILQFIGLVVQGFGVVTVSHAGHLGGFLVGAFLWWNWSRGAPLP